MEANWCSRRCGCHLTRFMSPDTCSQVWLTQAISAASEKRDRRGTRFLLEHIPWITDTRTVVSTRCCDSKLLSNLVIFYHFVCISTLVFKPQGVDYNKITTRRQWLLACACYAKTLSTVKKHHQGSVHSNERGGWVLPRLHLVRPMYSDRYVYRVHLSAVASLTDNVCRVVAISSMRVRFTQFCCCLQSALVVAFANIQIPLQLGELVNCLTTCASERPNDYWSLMKDSTLKLIATYLTQVLVKYARILVLFYTRRLDILILFQD